MANAAERDAFISQWGGIAHDVGYALGIAPEVVLGQAALESGWGKSVAGNNMFGIKGQGQMVTTHEDYGTGLKKTQESFRAYSTPEDSFLGYGALMGNDRYSGVRKGASVKDQIAAIGKSGYATDRNYTSKLSGVVGAIQNSEAFRSAQKSFQSGLVQDQVGVPDLPADLDLGIGPAIGTVESAPLPDIAMAPPDLPGALTGFDQPAPPAGFSLGAPDLPDFAGINADLMRDASVGDLYGAPFAPSPGFTGSTGYPSDIGPATTGFGGGNLFGPSDAPPQSFAGGVGYTSDIGPPTDSFAGPAPGFHAGVDGWGPTPDFNAPSLNERAQFQGVSDRHVNHAFDGEMAGLNGALMAELSRPTAPDFDRISVPETYTSFEERTREVPFSTPNALQDAYLGDMMDKVGVQRSVPATPSTRTISERVPVQQTRMVEKVVPRALPSLPAPIEIPGVPMAGSFEAAPPRSPGAFNNFNDYMSALGRGQADLPTGYNSAWGQTAFGDGVYSTVAHDDLQKATAADFGTKPVGSIVDAFNHDWDSLSPTAQGAIKGGVFGGPLGMVAGGALGWGKEALSDLVGYGGTKHGTLGSLLGSNLGTFNIGGFSLSDLFGGSGASGGPSFGGFSLGDVTLGGHDPFGGGFDFGGGGTFGGDPSQDGGSRYN